LAFSGFPFLLGFLPLLLGGSVLFTAQGDIRAKSWLIVLSLLFYTMAAADGLPLLLASVGGNYLLLRQMYRSPRAAGWVSFGVAVNLVAWGGSSI